MALKHIFTAPGGATRTLPDDAPRSVLQGFRGEADAPGGFRAATGTISKSEADAHPNVYTFGTEWRAVDPDDGDCTVWAGRLTDPQVVGGTVVLQAQGWAKKAERHISHLLWQTRDEQEWATGDSDPFSYAVADEIEGRINGRSLVFRVRNETIFKRKDGNPADWKTSLVFYLEGETLKRISFDWEIKHLDDYKLQVCRANGPNGALTVIQTFDFSAGALSGSFDSGGIVNAQDLIALRVVRDVEEKKVDGWWLKLTDVRVNGPFTVLDDYKTSDMLKDVADRVGGTKTGIQPSNNNGLPMGVLDARASEVADEIALLDDRPWLILDDGDGPAWKYRPWNTRVWKLTDERFPVTLLPVERFNEVVIPYKTKGGVRRSKRYQTPTIAGIRNSFRVDLDDPLPPVEVADLVGPLLVAALSETHFAGEAQFTYMEDVDAPGVRVPASRIKPGDMLRLQHHGNRTLRVSSVTYEDETVTVHFPERDPVIERFLRKRNLLLARGRGAASSTIGAISLGKPKKVVNASVAGTFKKQRKKNKLNQVDLRVDCDPVTEDVRGNATVIRAYRARLRPVDALGDPIPESAGGKVLERTVKDKDVGDADALSTRFWFRDLERPFAWNWQVQIEAEDILGKTSGFTAWKNLGQPGSEFDPPAPLSGVLDIDPHKASITVNLPADDEDAENADDRIHRVFMHLKRPDASTVWKGFVTPGLQVTKVVKLKQAAAGNYTCEVRTQDSEQRRSAVILLTGNKANPPTQTTAPTITFDRGGKKGIRAKVTVPAYSQSYLDDDITKLVVELQAEDANPTSSDPIRTRTIQVQPSDLTTPTVVPFGKIKKGEKVRARYFVRDRKDKESGRSDWSINYTAAVTRKPAKPGNVRVVSKTRAIVGKCDYPTSWADGSTTGFSKSEIARLVWTLKRNGVTVTDSDGAAVVVETQTNRVNFPLSAAQAGLSGYSVDVEAIGWDEDTDGVAASANTETPEGITATPSDGIAPTSSPTPTAFSHLRGIYVQWLNINNPDAMVFELHMGTSSVFVPTSSTLVSEVAAAANSTQRVAYLVTKQPGGGNLDTGVTYYFKTVAKDIDGAAPAGSASSGVQAGTLSSGDIPGGSIDYNKLASTLPAMAPPGAYSTTEQGSPPRTRLVAGPVGYKTGDMVLNTNESPARLYKQESDGVWWRATDGSDLTVGSLTADKIATGILLATLTVSGAIQTAGSGSSKVVMKGGSDKDLLKFQNSSDSDYARIIGDGSSSLIAASSGSMTMRGGSLAGGSFSSFATLNLDAGNNVNITPARGGVGGVVNVSGQMDVYGDIYEIVSGTYHRMARQSWVSNNFSASGHQHSYSKTPTNHGHNGVTGTPNDNITGAASAGTAHTHNMKNHTHSISNVTDVTASTT